MSNVTYENTVYAGSRMAIVGKQRLVRDGPGPEIMAASTLEGNDVINSCEENLGKIKEVMIDIPTGQIACAVLSSGGVLGIGDRQTVRDSVDRIDSRRRSQVRHGPTPQVPISARRRLTTCER